MVKLTYKEDNEKSDFQLKVIILSTLIGFAIIPLFMNKIVTLLVLLALGLLIGFLSKSDGEIDIYQDGELLSFKITPKEDAPSVIEKMVAYEFSWNYNLLDEGGGIGRNITFIFLKLELTTNDGKKYIIGKELKQWQSLPKDWDYKVLDLEEDHKMLIVSDNMDKIKKKVESTMNES